MREENTREGGSTRRGFHPSLNVFSISGDGHGGGKKINHFSPIFFSETEKPSGSRFSILRSELSEPSKRLTMGDMVS